MKANKTFVKLDAYGNLIPGSSIKTPSKPKTGKWKELDSNVCCNTVVELTYNFETTTPVMSWASLRIECSSNTNKRINLQSTSGPSSNSISLLTDYFNSLYNWLGVFSYEGTVIKLKLKKEIADSIDCNDSLKLIMYDND